MHKAEDNQPDLRNMREKSRRLTYRHKAPLHSLENSQNNIKTKMSEAQHDKRKAY